MARSEPSRTIGAGASRGYPSTGPARPSRSRGIVIAAAVTAVTVALGVLIGRTDGYASTSVAADPQTVWVTNNADYLVGRVNTQIDELDSAALLDGAGHDVLQDGRNVVVTDRTSDRLRTLNVATVSLGPPVRIPAGADVALGGDVLAVADRTTGNVWVLPAGGLSGESLTAADPTFAARPGVRVTVARDGTVAAVAPGSASVLVLAPGATAPEQQRLATPVSRPQDGTVADPNPAAGTAAGAAPGPASTADDATLSVTMVGNTPVVLDGTAGRLLVGAHSYRLPTGSSGAILQQPGPPSDAVLVATDAALLRVSLADGTVHTLDSGVTGTPAAPVWLAGCAHAAWDGSRPTYLRWCASAASSPAIRPIPQAGRHSGAGSGTAAAGLVFRVNGDTVVLNDVQTGNVWVADRHMTLINNWEQVAPQRTETVQDDTTQPDTGTATELTLSRTDCSGGMSPPAAVDDALGIRAGRPAILPVMRNDSVSDCSVTRIDAVSALPPDLGSVHIVGGGTALEVITDAAASGTLPALTYRLSDGAGHTSKARLQLHVVPDGTTPAPKKLRDSAAILALGGTTTTNVLTDWISPASDPLFLTAARSDEPAESVSFTADGAITVRDSGTGTPGKHAIDFTVSDGTNTVAGTLTVQVVSTTDLVPVPSGVYAATGTGTPVTIHPLRSVLSIGPDPLRLTGVSPAAGIQQPNGLTLAPDLATGTVVATANRPGTYYLDFGVAAGSQTANGVIRLDVTAPGDDRIPVAVVDTVYLPQGGTGRVDLVANDVDPAGDVLAVQRISVDKASPLVVTMTDMHIATISVRTPLPPGGAWFSYTVVGSGPPSTGQVHVVGVPPAARHTPVATPISLTVRAGDAVTVSVASAAEDPGGSALTVHPFEPLPDGQGLLFAAGTDIRYLAPETGSTQQIDTTYTVTNTEGRSDTAPLQIRVVPTGVNHPPRTPAVATARVFAGDRVTVPLPLSGTDPDGDWAMVTGIDTPPGAGSARVAGPSAVAFTAPDEPGTVSFRYTVTDPSGASATGTVVVGVVRPPDVVLPPVAPDLTATVAPGSSLAIDVLGSVTDPTGQPVRFADPGLTGPGGSAGVRGRIDGGRVIVTAGSRATVVPLTYTVRNAAGLTASGTITVTVTPDAPEVPPVAHDAFVDAEMLSPDGRFAQIDLTGRVADPAGSVDDLRLGLPEINDGAATRTGALAVRVRLTGGRQVLAYQVTNAAGLTASAFIVVPNRDEIVNSGTADRSTNAPPTPPPPEPPSAPHTGQRTRAAPPSTTAESPTTTRTTTSRAPTSTAPSTRPSPTTRSTPPEPPPRPVVSDLQVTLEAGGSTLIDLPALVRHAGRYDSLTFGGPSGARNGITASIQGSTLGVAADIGAPVGAAAELTVTVRDGVHQPVTARIAVNVIATSAPAPTVPDRSAEVAAGQSVTVNVLDGASNPLASQGSLALTGAEVTSGRADARFSPDGTVTVTPADGWTGTATVQVTATDPAGRSAAGTLTVTVLGPPDPPIGLTVDRVDDSQVVLTWSAPNDHGSPITAYLVSAPGSDPAQVDCGTQTTCTIKGLTNGHSYDFTVRARNDIGTSGPSNAVSAVPDVAPGTPDRPTVQAGDEQIQVRWTAPENDGSPIDHYEVTVSPDPAEGPATQTVTGTQTTIEHLVNGTSYRVTVAAVNTTGGTSPTSDPSDPVIPLAPPSPPGVPSLSFSQTDGGNVIDVAWDPPADDGGDPTPEYTVRWSATDGAGDDAGDGTVSAGTDRNATITSVTLGTTYTVRVVAANDAGTSPASEPVSIRPTTAPEQVTELGASPTGSSGQVQLGWSQPADGGNAITHYQYRSRTGDAPFGDWTSTPDAATAVTVTGLTDGSSYQFVVRACNGESSCGPASEPSTANPYGAPGTIADLSAYGTGTSGEVGATWSAPDDGGRTIVGYQYRYRESGGSYTDWTDTPGGTATSMSLSGFSDGEDYGFQVRAVTEPQSGDPDAGHVGAESNRDVATPCRPPDKMSAPTGSDITQHRVTLHWHAPFDGGRSIEKYQYRIGSGAWHDAGSGTSHRVTGLSTGTSYDFRIRACNEVACGTASSARSITTDRPDPRAKLDGWDSAQGYTGSAPGSETCNSSQCVFLRVRVWDFKPHTAVSCTWTLGTTMTRSHTFTTNSDGYARYDAPSYSGYRPLHVTCHGGGQTAKDTFR